MFNDDNDNISVKKLMFVNMYIFFEGPLCIFQI